MAGWRLLFEAVPTVRLLRMFLSKAGVAPSVSFLNVDVRLLVTSSSRTPILRCRWRNAEYGEEEMVEAKLPLCLVDHLVPVSVTVRADHLDCKLKLLAMESALLSVLEVEDSGGKEETMAVLRLEADLQAMAALEEVVFWCNACSAKLMKTPVTRVLELPSVNWQELSDDWYGGCCCEDKSRSRSLVARCGGSLIPSAGTCLLGPAFCVVDASDVVGERGFTGITQFRERLAAWLEHESSDVAEVVNDVRNGDGEREDRGCGEAGVEVRVLDDLEPGESHTHRCRAANLWADLPETAAVQKSFPGNAARLQGAEQTGSGWLPYLCHNCSSLIGSVAALQQLGNSVHELHLFKCHISTDIASGSRSNVFRSHTPEKVLANEILSRVQGDATYKFLVRDLQYKTPLLQLLVLNHEVWTGSEVVESGSDAATVSGSCPTRLQSMMKVGFRETSSLAEYELKGVEDWSRKRDVDDLLMWKEDASDVVKSLLHRKEMVPPSCQSFQQFSISFMEK